MFQVDLILNIKSKTLKIWENNIGKYLYDFKAGKNSIDNIGKVPTAKEKIDKLDYFLKWKHFMCQEPL